MTLAILLAKSVALAIGAWAMWDAHHSAALVCVAASSFFMFLTFLAWRDR